MKARPFRPDLRRGPGSLLVAVLAGAGTVLTLSAMVAAGEQLDWSSSGPGLVPWWNTLALLLGPAVAAGGAWAGSRERRLRVAELLAVVSRPRWQRHTADFVVLALATGAGILGAGVVGFATVAGAVSYSGGHWPLSVLLVVLGYLAWLALGLAVGRLLPYRFTAAIVGLACYLVSGLPTYVDAAAGQLSPLGNLPGGEGWRLRPGIAALAGCWLLALIATMIVAGGARRRWLALLPAVVALAVAVPLAGLPVGWTGSSYTAAWAEPDPRANEQVCSDGTPRVCVRRVHAALLPEVAAVARTAIPVTRFTIVERQARQPGLRGPVVPGELAVIPFLDGRTKPFTSALRDRSALLQTIRHELAGVAIWCPDRTAAMTRAADRARALLGVDRGPAPRDQAAADDWLDRYWGASQSCSAAAFESLAK